jgi:PadR family transcriptional regulator PadR
VCGTQYTIDGGGYMDKDNKEDVINNLIQELRRGTIVICVLSQLSKPEYGYNLVTNLTEKGFTIDPGTLYPLLRRLEKQGLLESKWDTAESRPRKYYVISKDGKEIFQRLSEEFTALSANIHHLINEGDDQDETDR